MVPADFGSSLPDKLVPPHGRVAVERYVGFNRSLYVLPDGTVSHDFEREHVLRLACPLPMLYAGAKVTRVACHQRIVQWVGYAFDEIAAADLWPYVQRYGGGFNPRLIRGGADYSMHTFGLAFDFDPDSNPLGALPHETRMGSTEGGRRVVDIFTRWGFLWGGYFDGRKDCQHFQWATGC